MVGSVGGYFLSTCIWQVKVWMSNNMYRYPITAVFNWIPVMRHLIRTSIGFHLNVSYIFSKLIESTTDILVVSPFESLICRYYSLEVSYFKSSLDRKLLEMLWNKYWVNTLSSSSLLTVSNKSHRSLFIPCHNTANQNTGKWLYIGQYLIHCVGHCIFCDVV